MGQLDSLAMFDAECCETAFSAHGHAAVTVGICIRWLLDWVVRTHSRCCRPIGIFHGRRICCYLLESMGSASPLLPEFERHLGDGLLLETDQPWIAAGAWMDGRPWRLDLDFGEC
ncbi:hypothetical protein ACLOJK_036823 [Asimina triloba]